MSVRIIYVTVYLLSRKYKHKTNVLPSVIIMPIYSPSLTTSDVNQLYIFERKTLRNIYWPTTKSRWNI